MDIVLLVKLKKFVEEDCITGFSCAERSVGVDPQSFPNGRQREFC